MTDGAKFGAEYLLYPGDPVLFHAQFTVQPMHQDQNIAPNLLLGSARGSHAARKHLLLASVSSHLWYRTVGADLPGGRQHTHSKLCGCRALLKICSILQWPLKMDLVRRHSIKSWGRQLGDNVCMPRLDMVSGVGHKLVCRHIQCTLLGCL